MDRSIRAKFPDDDHVLGPFLGNLPPEILDAVVRNLGWFRTTFAMAGRTCREAVDRVPSPLSVLTEDERKRFRHALREITPLAVAVMEEHVEAREITPLAVAVMEGDVEALEWLMQLFDGKGLNWRDDVGIGLSLLAARRGKIESLTCVRANGCPWDKWTCAAAASGGHLDVLQWARQNGCPWDRDTSAFAASGGHLDVLQWALQNGCPWDENTCKEAASGGHMGVLQWAHGNGCPWSEMTCRFAALRGQLEVLQWARENGCPWTEYTWKCAQRNCRPYLIEHGCPGAE